MLSAQVLSRVVDTVFTSVNIRNLTREQVSESMTLGQGGLGLDSVDILEVVVAVEHEFKVKVTGKELGQKVFQSIGTIASYVANESPLVADRAP